MAIYLAIVLIYAGFSFTIPLNLLNGFGIILLYIIFDLLWTFIRDKVLYLPLSSVISGCVLGIVSLPNPPLIWVLLLPFLAVFSKQLLHFGKMRHVFNPAAFAMVVAGFFFPSVTWWGTSWSTILLALAAVVALFILWSLRRFHVAISFLISYTIFLSIYLLLTGLSPENILYIFQAYLINGTLLFFTSVMLIEPVTSTFPSRQNQIIYAIFVGLFAIIATSLLKLASLHHPDPLLIGLLLGNFTASMLFLPKKQTTGT